MEEGCDAMNMIDKLNQEFDVIMEKNIQLEKEKLELYKEIHKLKFKSLKVPIERHRERWVKFQPSDELYYAVEDGLEKNVILCEIYDVDEWGWDQGCESYPVLNHIDLPNGVRITIMG